MITPNDVELLNAYLDDALLPDARAVLESRLAVDSALRAELDALRATRELVRALPRLSAPRSFALTREQAERASGVTLVRRLIPYVGAAAAALALAFGVLSFAGNSDPAPSQVAFANTQIVATATPSADRSSMAELVPPIAPEIALAPSLEAPSDGTMSGGIDPLLATASPIMPELSLTVSADVSEMAAQTGMAEAAQDDSGQADAAITDSVMRQEVEPGAMFSAPAIPAAMPTLTLPPTLAPQPTAAPPAPTEQKQGAFAILLEAIRALFALLFR